MQVPSTEITTLLALLAETPQRLAVMTHGLDTARYHTPLAENEWSVQEVLAHLRVCAEVWGQSIMAMITQERPSLRYVSPRTVAKKRNYVTQEYHPSLQEFSRQRTELLQLLTSLPEEAWSRGATFTGTTRGREQTIYRYVQRITAHEAEHIAQIATLLQTQNQRK